MAQAFEIAGLECTADALVWAKEVLRARFDEIVRLREAALRSEDIEAIHDMRVATRRFRSARRDFAPLLRKKPLREIDKELKRIADTLGSARDLDVAIAALEKLKAKARKKSIKKRIEKLIGEKRELRRRVQPDLEKALAEAAAEDLQSRFYEASEKALRPKTKAPKVSFNEAGREAVLERLREFCRLSDALYTPFEIEKLHRLRIAAKRLRYAIELFTACWGDRIAPFAAEVAGMQSFLGEVHDADAWIEELKKRLLDNGKNASARLWLLSRFVKLRTRNYRHALELRSRWKTGKFIERLHELVSTGS